MYWICTPSRTMRGARKSALTRARCNWSAKRAFLCRRAPARRHVMTMSTSAKALRICFCACNPLGWRQVNVTAQRAKQDFAHQMKLLVEVYFPPAELIRLVVDIEPFD